MPEETSQNQPAGQPRDQSRESGGEDILAIIRNVESQLDQLKQAKNDQERMLQTLLHQQSDLEQQDHQLVDRASRLEERERAVEDAEAKAAERAASLDRRAGELSGAEQEIAEQSRSLAEREESLAVREREAIEQQQAFEHQFAEILEQAQAFKSDRAEFTRARAELEAETSRLRERLERLEADLQTALDERGVLESDNARLRGELEAASASAEGAEATDEAIRSLKESLEKRDERISGLLERLEDARAEAARFRESLPDASSRDQRLAEAHEELESLRKQVAESIRSREELERLRAEHASLRERLEGEPDREATSGELAKLRESLSGAAEQAEAISAAGAGLARLQELISAQDLSPEASEKLAGEVEAQRARADAAREDAEELRQRLEEAMARMEELERTRQAPDDEAAREQIARRDRAIAQLTEQLKESETARAELSQKKASSGGEHEWERRRRERLRAIRNSLRDKASRLSQAKEIIEQRQSECEQILKLRSELAASREALKREKDDLAKTSAKSGAGVAAILAAVAMLALAPLAWKAATIFAPATHLSTAVIELRARDGGPLPAESRQRFQMLIADLAQDPQLVDQAAKRMQRRGIETYADAATLAAALRDRLDVSFPEIGAAEIAYTDMGDLLAKRTLETYIAAIVSAANDRSAARLENTTIAVRQAPSDPSPVDRGAQPLYAAGIWAGSSVVVLGFLMLVAIGMSKARERIRSEEAMLNAARDGSGIGWGDLPGS